MRRSQLVLKPASRRWLSMLTARSAYWAKMSNTHTYLNYWTCSLLYFLWLLCNIDRHEVLIAQISSIHYNLNYQQQSLSLFWPFEISKLYKCSYVLRYVSTASLPFRHIWQTLETNKTNIRRIFIFSSTNFELFTGYFLDILISCVCRGDSPAVENKLSPQPHSQGLILVQNGGRRDPWPRLLKYSKNPRSILSHDTWWNGFFGAWF